jgi:hypothetical protein
VNKRGNAPCEGHFPVLGKLLTFNFNYDKFDEAVSKKNGFVDFFFGYGGGGINESRRYLSLHRMQAPELYNC